MLPIVNRIAERTLDDYHAACMVYANGGISRAKRGGPDAEATKVEALTLMNRQIGMRRGEGVPKIAQKVSDQIRGAIIRGELKNGDTLPAEAHLIAEYQVSRPTLREAIRILESEELITVSRGARGGARICSPTFDIVARAAGIALQSVGATLGDLYEMLTLIAPPAARLVAERGGSDAVAALREQLDKETLLIDDRPAAVRAIASFHHILMEQCGNPALTMTARALMRLLDRHLEVLQRKEPSLDLDVLKKHTGFSLRAQAKLIDLIERRDGLGAEQHWLNHMRAAGVYWLAVVPATTVVQLLD